MGRRWHNTTIRWLSVYAVIFALSVMVLIGFIGWSATTRMEFDADSVLHWQIFYFGSIEDQALPATIYRRTEGEHLNTNYFGLFESVQKLGRLLIRAACVFGGGAGFV